MAVERKHEIVRHAQPWAPDWQTSIQAQIMEGGLAAAQAKLDTGDFDPANEYVEVSVPLRVKIQIPVDANRKLIWSDAGVQCGCIWSQPGVCKCTGPGAGDPTCNCVPETLPPVA
ncbi:hypothetical protein J2W42_004680 [Rhizobium tibeticum]|uniref:Uncharacterized protein n=1 Tax=Rhizobium tibeticum TaxID=501024 RepID=A0A1H8MIK5_9HYPH|nr:hypothetical protein [Rhizobium tibeticum]SEH91781.1 hypothetical protein RTCCBAU85039_3049 [Rhizobium tibeticum]SEO17110.1 hypothetical protein SAMN05216228_1012196 [Rhizobium tibeticum]